MSISHKLLLTAALAILTAPACSASGPDDGTSDDFDTPGDDLDQGPGPGTGDGTGNGTGDGTGGGTGGDDTGTPTPPPSSACYDATTETDSCVGDNICVDAACVPAFGRDYTLTVTLEVAELDKGSYWDVPPGSAPDAVYDLSVNGDMILEEYGPWNDVTPAFTDSVKAKLDAKATLLVDAWDNDSTTYADPIISCTKQVTAELLRARKAGCTADGSTVTIHMAP